MILTITANPAIDKVYFVDEFIMGNVYRPKKMTATAGGKGLNVSRVASILGESVMAMGFLGGNSGDFIREEVKKLGITENFTQTKGETRTCMNISDKFGKSGEILESGPAITDEEKHEFIDAFKKNVDLCNIVCVSGSLPKGLDSDFYCDIIELCNEKNKPVIVDTSGSTLQNVLVKAPFLVKPNYDELTQLTGKVPENNEDIKEFLDFLKSKGVHLPLVTLGKNGSVALVENEYYHFEVPEINIKNSVGSGDSTVAGIATAICRGYSYVEAIRFGMAAGVANTQFEQTGMVTKELVEKYYKEITVDEI